MAVDLDFANVNDRLANYREIDLAEKAVAAVAANPTTDGEPLRTVARWAVRQLRRAVYDLENPAYMYAGGRVTREALVHRDVEIDRLREELRTLKAANPRTA